MDRPSNRLLTYALVVQVVLALFAPPVPAGNRLIFPGDIWLFAWVPLFAIMAYRFASESDRKRDLVSAGTLGLVLGIVFLHGWGRPSLAIEMNRYVTAPTDDLFSFGREAVVAARFYAWCLGALIVNRLNPDKKVLMNALACAAGAAGLSLVLAAIRPDLRSWFGEIYRYDPTASVWANRYYGVFRSPIEGCATLSLAMLILVAGQGGSRPLRIFSLASILAGILLTRTLTAAYSAVLAMAIAYALTLSGPRRKLVLIGLPIVTAFITIATWDSQFAKEKRINFIFRFKPWSIYFDSSISRIDRLLFGNGFHPHFSDDIYVFLFSRGGLLLLGFAIWALVRWWKKVGVRLRPIEQAIPIFFLVSGLTVDSLILRPAAYLLICAGVIVLKPRRLHESPT